MIVIVRRVAGYARIIAGAAWEAFRNRRFYSSGRDAMAAFTLRVAATGPGARVLPHRERALSVRALAAPVYVRQPGEDIFAVKEIFEYGEYEAASRWRLAECATVIDLGANIGLATRYFAALAPSARFVAVEPDPDNVRILRMNCRSLIEAGRLQVLEAFVGADAGMATIDRSRGSLGFRMASGVEGDQIRRVGIDTVLNSATAHEIDLLKCDIEGAEEELFRACSGWISRVRHLIVETHAPYTPARLEADLRSNGWRFVAVATAAKGPHAVCYLERVGSPSPAFAFPAGT